MAQLVNEHERADHRHEHYGGEEQSWLRQEIHQQCLSRTNASARLLASRSQASTSSSAATSWTPTLASVCSTTDAISRNPRRPAKKAATATSLAAFNTVGHEPPLTTACRASHSAGHLVSSGASAPSLPPRPPPTFSPR